MIGRIWHGWTTPENADVYENLLKTEIFPGIAAKNVPSYIEQKEHRVYTSANQSALVIFVLEDFR